MSVEEKIKNIQHNCHVSYAEALACLYSQFLTPELIDDMIHNQWLDYDCKIDEPVLSDHYKEESQKVRSLSVWINRNIRPDHTDDNSVNIYSILTRMPFEKMKAEFIKNGH